MIMSCLDVRKTIIIAALTQNLLCIPRLFAGKGKCRSLFLGQGTGRRCQSTRKRTAMKKMAMTTTVGVLVQMPTKEQSEARALAGVMTVSGAAAAGGTTVPRGSGASHHALIADHKPPLPHPGLPRSPLSSPAKMKVGNTMSRHMKIYACIQFT